MKQKTELRTSSFMPVEGVEAEGAVTTTGVDDVVAEEGAAAGGGEVLSPSGAMIGDDASFWERERSKELGN